jgi:Ethanolamine utilization protein EutJ (predicted chaperonin)
MKKQTAIEWLIKKLYEHKQQSGNSLTFAQMKPLLEQAKEMEKQQIIKTRQDIYVTGDLSNEQYYNQTFKQD